MDMNKLRNNMEGITNFSRIAGCFRNIGIIVDELNGDELLSDLLEDSLEFISYIVEVEQEFDIEISDEYFQPGQLVCITDVADMIGVLIDEKTLLV